MIETTNNQLKNLSHIEHTRHRSVTNDFMNIVAGLIAYTWQDRKPSLNLPDDEYQALIVPIRKPNQP